MYLWFNTILPQLQANSALLLAVQVRAVSAIIFSPQLSRSSLHQLKYINLTLAVQIKLASAGISDSHQIQLLSAGISDSHLSCPLSRSSFHQLIYLTVKLSVQIQAGSAGISDSHLSCPDPISISWNI
jgi:hypothetical protein